MHTNSTNSYFSVQKVKKSKVYNHDHESIAIEFFSTEIGTVAVVLILFFEKIDHSDYGIELN